MAQLALLRSQAAHRGFGRQVATASSNFNPCADRMESVSSWFAILTCTLPTMQGRVACSDLFLIHGVFSILRSLPLSLSLFLACYLSVSVLLVLRLAAFSIPLFVMKVQGRTASCSKQLAVFEKRGTSECCRWLSSLQRWPLLFTCAPHCTRVSFVSLWNLQPKTLGCNCCAKSLGRHSSASVWHCSFVRQKPSRNEQNKSPDLACSCLVYLACYPAT